MKPKRPKQSKRRKEAVKHGYRSAFEYDIARDLDARGIKYTYEPKPPVKYAHKLSGGFCLDCGSKRVARTRRYLIDYLLANGKRIEAKGRLSASDRTKYVAISKQKGLAPICFLFAADNKLSKGSKTRYSDWAKANGFEYAIGKTIPHAWTLYDNLYK